MHSPGGHPWIKKKRVRIGSSCHCDSKLLWLRILWQKPHPLAPAFGYCQSDKGMGFRFFSGSFNQNFIARLLDAWLLYRFCRGKYRSLEELAIACTAFGQQQTYRPWILLQASQVEKAYDDVLRKTRALRRDLDYETTRYPSLTQLNELMQ